MKPCSVCKSENIYQYKKPVEFGGFGGELLPDLAPGMFSVASFIPVICADCGHIRFFASKEAREKLQTSEHWEQI